MVPFDLESESYEHAGHRIPELAGSASVDSEGRLHVSLVNSNPRGDILIKAFVYGMQCKRVHARVLQGESMNAHNTFERPDAVKPRDFNQASVKAEGLEITVPKMSVLVLEVT